MKSEFVLEIDPSWSDYDKTIARCHLSNYGRIYVDRIDTPHGVLVAPCDDEYETEDRHAAYIASAF